MTTAQALALVRDQADIPASNTNYDADIAIYIVKAVAMLYPVALSDIAPAVVAVNSDNRTITLPAGTLDIAELELDFGSGDYTPHNEYRIHGSTIKLDTYQAAGTNARIWGLGLYTVGATDGATTLPAYLDMVIVYWALSMFYASLAGNKRKYNIYVGAAGASGDRDMKDSAQFFREQGNDLLIDRVGIRGA